MAQHKDVALERAHQMFGLEVETVGRTEARQNFLPMCERFGEEPFIVEVTNREEAEVIIMQKELFDTLINKLWSLLKAKKKPDLMGSVKIVGDLERGSKEISEQFESAIEESARKLL